MPHIYTICRTSHHPFLVFHLNLSILSCVFLQSHPFHLVSSSNLVHFILCLLPIYQQILQTSLFASFPPSLGLTFLHSRCYCFSVLLCFVSLCPSVTSGLSLSSYHLIVLCYFVSSFLSFMPLVPDLHRHVFRLMFLTFSLWFLLLLAESSFSISPSWPCLSLSLTLILHIQSSFPFTLLWFEPISSNMVH